MVFMYSFKPSRPKSSIFCGLSTFSNKAVVALFTPDFREGLRRYIKIQWVRPLSRGLWQTQFATYDIKPGQQPSIVYWRATIRVAYAKLNFLDKDDKILNPYGFVVRSYSLAYHGAEGDRESYIDTARRRALNQQN